MTTVNGVRKREKDGVMEIRRLEEERMADNGRRGRERETVKDGNGEGAKGKLHRKEGNRGERSRKMREISL